MPLEKLLKACLVSVSLTLSSCNYDLTEHVSTKRIEPNETSFITRIDYCTIEEEGRKIDIKEEYQTSCPIQ